MPSEWTDGTGHSPCSEVMADEDYVEKWTKTVENSVLVNCDGQ